MIENKIYGLLGLARRAGQISFGTESAKETIEKNKAKLVIVAEDCSDRTKKNFEMACTNKNVPFRIYGTNDKISKCIGQENKAVIVIKNENFAKEMLNRIDGGEVIG